MGREVMVVTVRPARCTTVQVSRTAREGEVAGVAGFEFGAASWTQVRGLNEA